MKTLTKKLLPAVAMTVALFASAQAEAAKVTLDLTPYRFDERALSNPFSFTNSGGKTLTIGFSNMPVVTRIAAGDDAPTDPIVSQSYDAIGDAVEKAFDLTTPLTLESNLGGSFGYGANISGGNGTTQYFGKPGDMAFDILAIHFGGYEVAFQFANLVTAGQFGVTNLTAAGNAGGFSNYRLYNSGTTPPPPSAVPVPAAVWLFGSALLGLTSVTRRKKANSAVVEA